MEDAKIKRLANAAFVEWLSGDDFNPFSLESKFDSEEDFSKFIKEFKAILKSFEM